MRRPGPVLEDCARRFGSTFTLQMMRGRPHVIVSDPEDVRAVFAGSPDVFLSGKGNESFTPFLGESSLFVLDGEAHKRHRALSATPFRGERMRAYGPLVQELILRELARWEPGKPVTLLDAFHDVTSRVIFRAVFGVADEARAERLAALFAQAAGTASALVMFVPALQVKLGGFGPWSRYLETRRELDAILLDEIARARRSVGAREDILAKLIDESDRAGTPLSDAELRDELVTLLGAGHETTTSGLAWAFLWILGTPGVLAKVLEEVRAAAPGGKLDPEAMPRLRYLDAAIQEALRITPPIPIVRRWLAAPVTLGGHELPAGTFVCPSPYLAHRDARVFPDPLRFDPERFLGQRPPPHAFFPFGGGNRICIGLPFALYEMKVVLATVLANVDLRLLDAPSPRSRRRGIIIVPESGTRVVLERRVA
jgi:cytochrome P450